MEQNNSVRLIAALQRATHAVGRWLERELRAWRLSQAEAHVLAYLAVAGTRPISDLHRHFGHRRSTLTNVLDRLEARGMVRRTPNPASRRSTLVELTEAGREAGARVAALFAQIDRAVRERVTSKELVAFHTVIATLEEETR
jgi:DNA-binding MarR family transcriptional regulator